MPLAPNLSKSDDSSIVASHDGDRLSYDQALLLYYIVRCRDGVGEAVLAFHIDYDRIVRQT